MVDLIKALLESIAQGDELLSKPEDQNMVDTMIVSKELSLSSSLKTGIIGEDRRLTYLAQDTDDQSSCVDLTSISDIGVIEEHDLNYSKCNDSGCIVEKSDSDKLTIRSLRSGPVGEDRRSTYLAETKDNESNCVIKDQLLVENSSSLHYSLGSGIIDESRSSTHPTEALDGKNSNVLEKSNSVKRSLRSSLRYGVIGPDRRSTYLAEANDGQTSCAKKETNGGRSSSRRSLRTSLVQEVRPLMCFKEDKGNKSLPLHEKTDSVMRYSRPSLRSGVVGLDRRSTYIAETEDDKNYCVTKEPSSGRTSLRNSSRTVIIREDGESNYFPEANENESLGLVQDLDNSFIENEEHSLLRMTPFKNDKSLCFIKKQENDHFEMVPVTDLKENIEPKKKKGVTFSASVDQETSTKIPKPAITKTPHKVKIISEVKTSFKKAPNFMAIHKNQFKKMESLVDVKKRFAENAKRMLNSPDVPRCALMTRVSSPRTRVATTTTPSDVKQKQSKLTPNLKTPGSAKVNRFGFKPRMTMSKEIAKQLIKKDTPIQCGEERKKEDKQVLQGVRLNRRFTLHMQARGLQQ
uniref:Uncharacterized protein n=1 Tax=Clastoptera arizonana TaxID=38151 RepID=A0A1B6BWK8_9HEMI